MPKIAIITSDRRDLKFDDKKNYVELCALINLNYAIKKEVRIFLFFQK